MVYNVRALASGREERQILMLIDPQVVVMESRLFVRPTARKRPREDGSTPLSGRVGDTSWF
jgi:hypothetical protein